MACVGWSNKFGTLWHLAQDMGGQMAKKLGKFTSSWLHEDCWVDMRERFLVILWNTTDHQEFRIKKQPSIRYRKQNTNYTDWISVHHSCTFLRYPASCFFSKMGQTSINIFFARSLSNLVNRKWVTNWNALMFGVLNVSRFKFTWCCLCTALKSNWSRRR